MILCFLDYVFGEMVVLEKKIEEVIGKVNFEIFYGWGDSGVFIYICFLES